MAQPSDSFWNSYIQAPRIISQAEDVSWDQQTEVAVVGCGAAGASAALQAAEGNASVMLIDRFNGGGASELSGGIIYLGGGTWCQQQAGFEDSPEEMFKYLQLEAKGVVKDETLRRFCDNSVETMSWLESHGVGFSASLSPVKTSYPTNKYFLYYSGNELIKEYSEVAKPAPRGHRVKWNGFSGEGLMAAMVASCEANRLIENCYQSRVHRLIMDEDGTVLGLELLQLTPGSDAVKKHARAYNLYKRFRLTMPPLANYLLKVIDDIEANAQAARPRLVRITRGVVLAAGGFIFNREMAEHYVPKYTMGMPLGTPGCDGSGIRLGESVGAATELMEKGSAWRFINPPQSFVEGIVVNPDGERFVNELSYGAKIGEHLAEKYQGKGTLIVNRALVKKALPQLMPGRAWLLFQTLLIFLSLLLCTKRAKTIEQLAEKCGLQSDRLRATIERYNEAIATGTEDPLGKGDEYRHSLAEGPYYAIDISIGNPVFPCATLTFGGLQVDEGTGQVRREDGSVFKNLYAAGRTAVGFSSRSYVSGLSLSDCIFSGRRAGQHMAESE